MPIKSNQIKSTVRNMTSAGRAGSSPPPIVPVTLTLALSIDTQCGELWIHVQSVWLDPRTLDWGAHGIFPGALSK